MASEKRLPQLSQLAARTFSTVCVQDGALSRTRFDSSCVLGFGWQNQATAPLPDVARDPVSGKAQKTMTKDQIALRLHKLESVLKRLTAVRTSLCRSVEKRATRPPPRCQQPQYRSLRLVFARRWGLLNPGSARLFAVRRSLAAALAAWF